MATLAQAINTGSNLSKMTSEELAAQQGRQAAPISPMETKVIGANKDQAKMAGTPMQKAGALRTSIQEAGKDLQTNERLAQVDKKQSAAEATKVQNAGMMTDRFGKVEGQLETMQQEALKNAEAEMGYKEGTSEQDKALLDTIKNGVPGSPEVLDAVAKLNTSMGRDANTLLTGEELMSQFSLTPTEMSAAVGQTFQDTLATGSLNLQELGFSSPAEMAGLLGITEQEMGAMSIPQILDKINSQIQTEYQEVNKTTAKANDAYLSPAERAEARKSLREMGAVGVRSA
jgi:hypothetical protein